MAARPRLNATISSIPSAICPWATAPSSTTSADGHGIRPADAPIAISPRHESCSGGACEWPCSWSCDRGRARGRDARGDGAAADAAGAAGASAARTRRRRARAGRTTRFSHGNRSSGSTYSDSPSATSAEREHADGVRDRHGGAERHGVPRRPARADQVRGHHRLAVARRERVQRAPGERGQQQQDEHALARRGGAERARERRRRRARRRARPARPSGACSVPSPGATANVASRTSAGLLSASSG